MATFVAMQRFKECIGGNPGRSGYLLSIDIATRFVLEEGVKKIRMKEQQLTSMLIEGLEAIGGVSVLGCRDACTQTAAVSSVMECMSPSDLVFTLDGEFHVMARPRLQCAPAAHKTIGTFSEGIPRLSPEYFTTEN